LSDKNAVDDTASQPVCLLKKYSGK